MTMRKSLAFAIVLFTLASPVSGQNREHQQMAAELRMLQEQTQQLAITLAALNQALAESLKTLNARLDEAGNAMRKGFADQKLIVDNVAADVSKIRERAGDTNVRIGSLQEELEAMRVTVQALQQGAPAPAPLDPSAPVDPAASTPLPAPIAPPVAPPSTAGLSPTRLFDTAQRGLLRRPVEQRDQRLRSVPPGLSAFGAGRRRAVHHRRNIFRRRTSGPRPIAAYNQVIQIVPGHELRAGGVLQARARAGTARPGRRGARVVGNGVEELPRQRRRDGSPSRIWIGSIERSRASGTAPPRPGVTCAVQPMR